jgi:type IV pilus assembly protein PilO
MALTLDSIVKMSTSKKIVLLVILLVAIAGIYYYLILGPQQERLGRLRDDLNKAITDLNKSKAIQQDLVKFKEQVVKLNQELQVARTQLPSEKEIPELLKNISSIGKESSLDFILFRPKAEEPQQFYAKVPIDLNVVGTYHNVGLFFDRVSKLPRIINVIDFSMTRFKEPITKGKAEVREENLVRTTCLLNTYRFIEGSVEDKKAEDKKSGDKKSGEKKTAKPKGK